MQKELSSLDLHCLIKELQALISAKVEQIYQIEKDELFIQLHVPSQGKHLIRIVLGKLIYLASNKAGVPEKPPGFCLFLRKKLKNARLRSITQLGFERAIEFLFETKEDKFRLIVESFSTGNIILCDENGIILSPMKSQDWKDRILRPKEIYIRPTQQHNILEMTEPDLNTLLRKSDKESLVKSLAIELSLGGTYAEELCLTAKLDKNMKPNQLSDKETKELFGSIQALISRDIDARIVMKDCLPKDITPFPLEIYKDLKSDTAGSFNQALDSILTRKAEQEEIMHVESKAESKLKKIELMIHEQEQRMKGLEASAEENQRKGELIYENYPLAEQILKEIKEKRKTHSWAEIKELLKHNKLIKNIDESTGDITVEL
jgi:predicted ribosome quality control (RQC) complex YloA/Tae2 family protein